MSNDGGRYQREETDLQIVGYTRLSQEGSDVSIPRQKEEIREYAETKGFELIEIYDEGAGESGFDPRDERTQYSQLMKDAEAGEFDGIVVADGSRLGRDKKERLRAFLELDEWGIELHSALHGFIDSSDPDDFLMEVFRAVSDDRVVREQVMKARREVQKRKDAGYYQGRPKRGTCFNEEGTYLVAADGFEDVVDVFDLRKSDSDEWSYRKIADATGIPKSAVGRILKKEEEFMLVWRRSSSWVDVPREKVERIGWVDEQEEQEEKETDPRAEKLPDNPGEWTVEDYELASELGLH